MNDSYKGPITFLRHWITCGRKMFCSEWRWTIMRPHSNGRLLALPSNIRKLWEWIEVANTLAYYYTATIVNGYLSTIKKYQNHFIIKNWQITSARSEWFWWNLCRKFSYLFSGALFNELELKKRDKLVCLSQSRHFSFYFLIKEVAECACKKPDVP